MTKPSGYWDDWKTVEKEIKKAIRLNRGEFPSKRRLLEMGRGDLIYAIGKHGGFAAARERSGYNEEMRRKLAKQLDQIVEDTGIGRKHRR